VLGALPGAVTLTARAATVVEELRHSYGDNVATIRLIVRLPQPQRPNGELITVAAG
jgi:hypothetical protein